MRIGSAGLAIQCPHIVTILVATKRSTADCPMFVAVNHTAVSVDADSTFARNTCSSMLGYRNYVKSAVTLRVDKRSSSLLNLNIRGGETTC